MKHCFLVIALGYWGRGQTIEAAATQCRMAGALPSAKVAVMIYLHPSLDPEPKAEDMLIWSARKGSYRIEIGIFKLAHLLAAKTSHC